MGRVAFSLIALVSSVSMASAQVFSWQLVDSQTTSEEVKSAFLGFAAGGEDTLIEPVSWTHSWVKRITGLFYDNIDFQTSPEWSDPFTTSPVNLIGTQEFNLQYSATSPEFTLPANKTAEVGVRFNIYVRLTSSPLPLPGGIPGGYVYNAFESFQLESGTSIEGQAQKTLENEWGHATYYQILQGTEEEEEW